MAGEGPPSSINVNRHEASPCTAFLRVLANDIACPTGHRLDKLIGERGSSRVANSDGIEGLEIMYKAQGAVLLLDTE